MINFNNYHSFYLPNKLIRDDKTLEIISKAIKFTFPKEISLNDFFSKIIIPVKRFFELTESVNLIPLLKKCEIRMLFNNDFTDLYLEDIKGNCSFNHKRCVIDFRYTNRNIIDLFHELTHLIDFIQDKYCIRLENELLGYFSRPSERIANCYAISLYESLIGEFKEIIDDKTISFIESNLIYNVKTNLLLISDFFTYYNESKELRDYCVERIDIANKSISKKQFKMRR